MKIAIETSAGRVSGHSGYSECFEIFRISGSVLDMKGSVPCPSHDSCKLPGFLRGLVADV